MTFDSVGRAIRDASTAGQSQPSFRMSQAHKTCNRPSANSLRCRSHLGFFMRPDTLADRTPRVTEFCREVFPMPNVDSEGNRLAAWDVL